MTKTSHAQIEKPNISFKWEPPETGVTLGYILVLFLFKIKLTSTCLSLFFSPIVSWVIIQTRDISHICMIVWCKKNINSIVQCFPKRHNIFFTHCKATSWFIIHWIKYVWSHHDQVAQGDHLTIFTGETSNTWYSDMIWWSYISCLFLMFGRTNNII